MLPLLLLVAVVFSAGVQASSNGASITIAGTPHAFNNSAALQFGTSFRLLWTILPGGSSVKFGVEATTSEPFGWVALGFNRNGQMMPSRAILALQAADAAQTTVQEYDITAKSAAAVIPATVPVVMEASGAYNAAGTAVSFVFTIPVASQDGLIVAQGLDRTSFIFATGPRPAAGNALSIHTDARSMSVALNVPAGTPPSARTETPSTKRTIGLFDPALRPVFVIIHAVSMAITWLLLVPIAVMFAHPILRRKLFKSDIYTNPRYSLPHKIGMAFALFVMVIGYGTGYLLIGTRSLPIHFTLGTAVAGLVVLQCILGLWRSRIQTLSPPPKRMRTIDSGYRAKGGLERGNTTSTRGGLERNNTTATTTKRKRAFGHAHKNTIARIHAWSGRLIWAGAVANIYFGLEGAGYSVTLMYAAAASVPVSMGFFLYGPISAWKRG